MHRECFNLICVVLEDCSGQAVEEITDTIFQTLYFQGEDILSHLDPPQGLQRWLESHGLSLVPTREVAPPRQWDDLEEEEAHPEQQSRHPPEGGRSEEGPPLQVGDYVAYSTAPAGPRKVSTMGSGAICEICEDHIVVQGSPNDIYLYPAEGDIIKVTRSS